MESPSPESAELLEGTVGRVEVQGVRTVPDRLVYVVIETETGAPLDPDTVAADVERILALEAFESVRVRSSRGELGIEVTYEITERPLVRHVWVQGAGEEVPAADRLALIEGEVYQPLRMERAAARLAVEHHREGYLQAEAEVHARRIGQSRVDVCFVVDPGPRYSIERFEFVGNERVPDGELLALVRTYDERVNVEDGIYREDLLSEDLFSVLAHYYDRGMLSVRLEDPRVEWADDGLLTIEIRIEEGPVFRIGEITVSGDLVAEPAEYLDRIEARQGDVFSRARFVEGIERIYELDRQRGREEVIVEPMTHMDVENRVVDVEIVLRGPSNEATRVGAGSGSGLLDEELQLDEEGLRLDVEAQ